MTSPLKTKFHDRMRDFSNYFDQGEDSFT